MKIDKLVEKILDGEDIKKTISEADTKDIEVEIPSKEQESIDNSDNDIINEEVNKEEAKKAIIDAAKDIHGEPDEKIINSMMDKAMKKAKDTEDLVQIVISMMRSK